MDYYKLLVSFILWNPGNISRAPHDEFREGGRYPEGWVDGRVIASMNDV